MLGFLRTKLFRHVRSVTRCLTTETGTTVSKSDTVDPSSLTVHFLKNSCGVSTEAAVLVADKFQLKATKNPHTILSLLKDYGFSKTQIARLVTRRPKLLLASPNGTLKPKLDFFKTLGLCGPDLGAFLCSNPDLLLRSVDNLMIPNFNILKTIFHTDQNVIAALKNSPSLLASDLRNVQLLQDHGVPMPVILKLLTTRGSWRIGAHNRSEEILEAMRKMGIRPSTSIFAHAFGVFGRLPKLEWKRKLENYKSLGWSEDEVFRAFAKHPYCMSASSEKIRKNVRFFTEKLNFEPAIYRRIQYFFRSV